ncbi:hypothetical protein DMN91_003383 [Ooceraea biroi]|uniref:PiggyBac transposable element-derived protein domain-containing protein n=1 Tax=Ooceraea biroi TaxID=2015173 RepID=A0A3L8DXT3_OOCBI|nr:hypothetical protein DMN91_003383 [Ooceraea biroi]
MCSFVKRHEGEATLSEMYYFFAIRLLMSRVKKLHYSEYWTKDKFLRTDIFGRIMSRDRYVFLLRILYFSEITTANSDRLVKIREFCSKLRLSFQNYFSPFRNLCIDESLLLYKGRLSFKQYIPSKRNRFGIKSFILCDCKSGYVLNFIVYAGSDSEVTKINEKSLGKSGEIVISLLESYLGKGHTLFVDNWYSSPALFTYLHDNTTNACGTMKRRRKGMPIISEKLNRGEMCFRSSSKMLALKWQDKREVYMLSTYHSADFINTKKINYRTKQVIQKPSCIVNYTTNMGAVDNRDKVIASVESIRKSTKWYKKYFFHLLDVAIWNAFCLYKMKRNEKITMRAFHLRLIKEIIKKYGDINNNFSNRQKSTADHPLRLTERHFPSFCKTVNTKKTLRNCVVCAKNDVRRRSRYESYPFLMRTPYFYQLRADIPSALYFEPISKAEGFEDPTCISGLAEKREEKHGKEGRRDRHVEWEPLGHSLRDTSEEVPKCLCV